MIDSRGSPIVGQALAVNAANGTALTAAAEALLIPDFNVPAGFMAVGRTLRCILSGRASSAITTPGTLTLRVRWGGVAGVVLADSGALTQNIIAQTDKTWWWEVFISCWTAGAAGTFMTVGRLDRGSRAAAVVADIPPDLTPPTAPVVVTVDTTIAKALSFTAQPSLATASIQCHHRIVYAVN